MKSKIAVLATALVALAGCQTTQVDQVVQDTLPKACTALKVAYAGFSGVAATGVVKARTIDKVNAVYSGVQVACVNPETANSIDVILRVSQATIVITQALKEVRNEPVQ